MRARERWALLCVAALTALTFLQFCNAIFDCGCRAWWAGGAAHCDVQVPGAPDCPICAGGDVRFFGLVAVIVLAELAAIVGVSRKVTPRFAWLLVAGAAAYVATTLLAAGVLSLG